MAQQIKETSIELMDMTGDTDHRLRKILKCDVQTQGGYTYITPTAEHPLPAGVILQGAGAAPITGAEVDIRAGWPQAMRQRPAACGRIAGADVKTFLLQLEDQAVKDIRAVSAALYEASSQDTIPEVMSNFTLPRRYKAMSNELAAIQTRWCPGWVPQGAMANPTLHNGVDFPGIDEPIPSMEGQIALPAEIPFEYIEVAEQGEWIIMEHYVVQEQGLWRDLAVNNGGPDGGLMCVSVLRAALTIAVSTGLTVH